MPRISFDSLNPINWFCPKSSQSEAPEVKVPNPHQHAEEAELPKKGWFRRKIGMLKPAMRRLFSSDTKSRLGLVTKAWKARVRKLLASPVFIG